MTSSAASGRLRLVLNLQHSNLSRSEEDLRRELHELGLSDADAARFVDVTSRAFTAWRCKRSLPGNHGMGGDRTSHEARHARRERLRVAAQHTQREAWP